MFGIFGTWIFWMLDFWIFGFGVPDLPMGSRPPRAGKCRKTIDFFMRKRTARSVRSKCRKNRPEIVHMRRKTKDLDFGIPPPPGDGGGGDGGGEVETKSAPGSRPSPPLAPRGQHILFGGPSFRCTSLGTLDFQDPGFLAFQDFLEI